MADDYDLGILGVGEIGAAIVTGLCEGLPNPPSILLSPRNADRAAALAARYPTVDIAPDNQSLADECWAVVLAVRPADGPAVLGKLRFRPGQEIVSVMAGISHEQLGPLVAPATEIARAIPLPPVSRRNGLTPVYPATAAARELFGRLGGAMEVAEGGAFEAMSAATGTVAAHLRYLSVISGWLSEQGVAPDAAASYVRLIFAGLADDLASSPADLDALTRAHATPGGINERFSAMLERDGAFRAVGQSLQAIYDGLNAG